MNRIILMALVAACLLVSLQALADEGHDQGVYFKEPADSAVIYGEVKIVMGVRGVTVHPAGEVTKGTGHHHLIIDGDPVAKGKVVPKDEQHLHFGKGQTETIISLEPGKHALTLQFADGAHHSYGKAMSSTIHITVKKP